MDLPGLRAKYVEMRALRVEHAEGRERDAIRRMRALASRFPGALREIDELPLEVIDARIAALDEAIAGASAPPWARYLSEYHAWMRAALGLRRAAGRDRDRTRAIAWIYGMYREPDPDRASLEAELDALLRPPQGRLSRWVIARIAEREGKHARQIEEEAFPRSPRRGSAARNA